jgi:ribosome assembly protein 1
VRSLTLGASNAQLMLSHWERLDIDPFFTPRTEEEREEFGEDGDAGPNIARKLVDATRRRKGLKVRLFIVLHKYC